MFLGGCLLGIERDLSELLGEVPAFLELPGIEADVLKPLGGEASL